MTGRRSAPSLPNKNFLLSAGKNMSDFRRRCGEALTKIFYA
jgi:hypothetical protein